MQELKVYYDRAMQLQKNYDSVVWYTQHKDTTYYYAVNGNYVLDSLNKNSPAIFKMGLVHENGKVIIPVEYDLIGNPSINFPAAVEVKRDGKVGYFDLTGRLLVPAEYTWVVPYEEGETKALVKKDTVFGWLDASYQYHENFPSEKAQKYIRDFTYLTEKKFVFGSSNQTMLEMFSLPRSEGLFPTSLIVIPAFLSQNGIFNRVEYGFIGKTTSNGEYFVYGNDYIENENEKPFSVSETIEIFISNFKTRYVGGRGEFYTSHSITVVDRANNRVNTISTNGDYDFHLTRLTDNLFESRFFTEIMGPDDIAEQNYPDYNYFSFDGKKLIELKSNRRFKFTQFLKLDSSYLTGNFTTFDFEKGTEGKSNFLSSSTLNLMSYEILADNHFAVNDQKMLDNFKHFSWYQPSMSSYEEVYAKASEIDKYNLDFLEKILGP
ncbi:MAG: WG repeat-containing protein, partial [Flammeovirgaceae bacterium]